MVSSLNPFTACLGVLYQPKATFAALKGQLNWSWLPFLLVLLAAILPVYYYFQVVDFQWYKDLIISSQFANVSPGEQQAVSASLYATKGILGTIITPLIMMLVLVSLIAIYLNIVTKSDPQNIFSFSDWFGFSWWVLLPSCVSALLSGIIIFWLNHGGQISFDAVSPSALSFLFAIPVTSTWFGLASSIKLEIVWSMYLVVIGVTQWVNISWRKAVYIAFTPCVALWFIWALAIMFY
jgi:hypothetical protein